MQTFCQATQIHPPRVGSAPNSAVLHGPIAPPNLLCAFSASHRSFVRATKQLTEVRRKRIHRMLNYIVLDARLGVPQKSQVSATDSLACSQVS
jgi:hypothetical protein